MMIGAETLLLNPGEAELAGFWIDLGSRMEKADNWQRIGWLTGRHLVEPARADNGLQILYRDPSDQRLREQSRDHFPSGDGGPPRLSVVDHDVAASRYPVKSPPQSHG